MIVTDATNLPRLMQCLGSLEMPVIVQDYDDPEARDEGNAAHYMALQVFNGVPIESLIGTRAYNGYLMDAEMAQYVNAWLIEIQPGQMEVPTTLESENWLVNGRADHITALCHPNDQYEAIDTLIIDDFKFGHRLVMPDMNWTLIFHAIGYCINHGIMPSVIKLRIFQPRRHHPDGPLREWSISYQELTALYQHMNARLSSGDDTLHTGPACVTCRSNATCPAFREASMNAIDAASVLFSDDLPPEALSWELDLLEQAKSVIESRHKALQELAKHKIQNGTILPMYSLETQYANRRFKKSFSTPEAIKALCNVPCTKETLVSPAQLEHLGVSKDIVSLLTERPVTGVKLVRGDADSRARKLLKKGK